MQRWRTEEDKEGDGETGVFLTSPRSQRKYRECSSMCFTESWMHQDIPNDNTSLEGFHILFGQTGIASVVVRRKEVGLLFLLYITIKERFCCPDIELCAVGLGSYHLPREFTHVRLLAVYVPPSANPRAACDTTHSAPKCLHSDLG